MSKPASYIELLYLALASEIGIVLSTDNPSLLQQKLYAARRKACDPELDQLSLTPSRSSPDTELWIVKKTDARNKHAQKET